MDAGLRSGMLRLPMPPTVRARLAGMFGATVGANVRLHPVRVMNARWSNLVVEDDCYVGPDVLLDLADTLTIRRGSVLAAGSMVFTHQDAGAAHDSPTARRIGTFHRPTSLGPNAFLGAGAIVLAGCDVGEEAVVGAGVTAHRPVPAGTTRVRA